MIWRSFLSDQTGCPLAGGCRSYETSEEWIRFYLFYLDRIYQSSLR
ncbi:hypothetical protein D1AOALGA4SA_10121 [Olavius algarvensis Delta 1 endosymbiont]|nr:hypothetical protein D1AOALGA4SA_10121 [Olavius algarvensis Delta 1 endosymbiont]